MIRDVPLSEPGWAWGRNGELQRPHIATVRSTPVAQAPDGYPEAPGVAISIYSQRGYARGSSPLDLHLNRSDARALAEAILAAARE